MSVCLGLVCLSVSPSAHTERHTHIYIYILYIVCVCVCVSVCNALRSSRHPITEPSSYHTAFILFIMALAPSRWDVAVPIIIFTSSVRVCLSVSLCLCLCLPHLLVKCNAIVARLEDLSHRHLLTNFLQELPQLIEYGLRICFIKIQSLSTNSLLNRRQLTDRKP
jgi:hypothetical protein